MLKQNITSMIDRGRMSLVDKGGKQRDEKIGFVQA